MQEVKKIQNTEYRIQIPKRTFWVPKRTLVDTVMDRNGPKQTFVDTEMDFLGTETDFSGYQNGLFGYKIVK